MNPPGDIRPCDCRTNSYFEAISENGILASKCSEISVPACIQHMVCYDFVNTIFVEARFQGKINFVRVLMYTMNRLVEVLLLF